MSSPALVPLLDGTADLARRVVVRGERRERLTEREARLIAYLLERRGQTVPREELLVEVWEYAPGVVSRALDTAVRRLRKKIERDPSDPEHLLSEYGVGYRFEPADSPSPQAARPAHHVARPDLDDAVARALEASRLVTLWGPGGIGKTAAAEAALRRHVGPTARAHLGGLSGVDAVAAEIGRALRVILDVSDPAASIRAALRARDLLLLIDEAEAVRDEVATLLAEALHDRPGARVLVTSRVALDLPTERRVSVPPMTGSEGIRLLRRHLERLDAPPATDEELAALAEALDGLPLALELAASRALLMTVSQQLDALQGRRTIPVDERLARSVADSLGLLSEPARQALGALAVFRGAFTAEDALAVLAEDDLAALQELVRASLLQRVDGGALRLLTLVRVVVEADGPPGPETRRAHAAWVAARAAEAWDQVHSPDAARGLQALGRLLPEALAAWPHLPTPADRARLCRDLAPQLDGGAPASLFERLLTDVLRAPETLDPDLHGWLLATLALHRSRTVGDPDALDMARRAHALSVGPAARARTWEVLARLLRHDGHYAQALEALRSGLDAVGDAPDTRRHRAILHAQLGATLHRHDPGRASEALELLERGLFVLDHDDPRCAAGFRNDQARLLHEAGRTDEAIAVLRRGADAAGALGDRRLEGGCRANLGLLLLDRDTDEAAEVLEQALERLDGLQQPFMVTLVRSNLAWALLDQGCYDDAISHLAAGTRHTPRPWYLALLHAQRALVLAVAGRDADARDALDTSRTVVLTSSEDRRVLTAMQALVAARLDGTPPPPPPEPAPSPQIDALLRRFRDAQTASPRATSPR